MNGIREIGYNLRHLADFRGRQGRGWFWPYAAFVLLVVMAISTVIGGPMLRATMAPLEAWARAHPDDVTVTVTPGGGEQFTMAVDGVHPMPMPDFGPFIALIAVLCLVAIVLLAAAVTRRLHDRGRSGLWGLLPLPFLAFSMTRMSALFAQFPPEPAAFLTVLVSNLLYLVALSALCVLLAQRGDAGPNRHGQPLD